LFVVGYKAFEDGTGDVDFAFFIFGESWVLER
jgi:hypothetical protein